MLSNMSKHFRMRRFSYTEICPRENIITEKLFFFFLLFCIFKGRNQVMVPSVWMHDNLQWKKVTRRRQEITFSCYQLIASQHRQCQHENIMKKSVACRLEHHKRCQVVLVIHPRLHFVFFFFLSIHFGRRQNANTKANSTDDRPKRANVYARVPMSHGILDNRFFFAILFWLKTAIIHCAVYVNYIKNFQKVSSI